MAVTYRPAPAVERIADKLIAEHHTHLEGVRVEYVFRSKAARTNGKIVMGKARKVSGLTAYLLHGFESDEIPDGELLDLFVVEIAENVWSALTEPQRVALVDHELTHCCVEDGDEADELVLSMRPHDLEEFRAIVERHGLWQPDVAEFAKVVAQQTLAFGDD